MGRWVGIDPQAESAESMSVYQYAGNNPVMMNDPLGDKVNPDYVPVQPGWEDPHGIIAMLRDFDEADARLTALMHGGGGGSGITNKSKIKGLYNALVAAGSNGVYLDTSRPGFYMISTYSSSFDESRYINQYQVTFWTGGTIMMIHGNKWPTKTTSGAMRKWLSDRT